VIYWQMEMYITTCDNTHPPSTPREPVVNKGGDNIDPKDSGGVIMMITQAVQVTQKVLIPAITKGEHLVIVVRVQWLKRY
jgi:hypothetical protein